MYKLQKVDWDQFQEQRKKENQKPTQSSAHRN